MRYVVGRCLQALVVLWAAFTATFVLLSALPGDGILIKFQNPQLGIPADQVAQIREYYRVDEPLIAQYFGSLGSALRGDFGYSIVTGTPVAERVAVALPQTLELAAGALVAALALALLITAACQLAPFQWLRSVLDSVPSLLISIPAFWLGLVLIQVFSFQLGWVPMIGASSTQALLLPVLTLAVPISAPLAQVLTRSLDEVNMRPFVQVLRAKGASGWWILSRHATKNALLPTLTIAGLIVGELIGGSVVVETVFSRAGIGRLASDSVAAQDLPVIQAIVLLAAFAFVAVNLIVDMLYPIIDPRLRHRRSRRSNALNDDSLSPVTAEVTPRD